MDPWATKMLKRMSFMPGTYVEVTGDGSLRLMIEFAWGDVRYEQMAPGTMHHPTRLATMHNVPMDILLDMKEEPFFAFVRDCIRAAMVHEADEWTKVDGDARWNPHRSGYDEPIRPGRMRR